MLGFFQRMIGMSPWPDGWSQPSPLWNKRIEQYEPMPIVWVKGRPVRQKDKDALAAYYDREFQTLYVDQGTLCGKRDPAYKQLKSIRQKELQYNFFERLRF